MKKIVKKILELFNKKSNYLITIIKKSPYNKLGMTAVKSADNFWYVGNLYDNADIAYGIASNGEVEHLDHDLVKKIINKIISYKEKIFFYDIGANTGYYGIFLATTYKNKLSSYFFEPLDFHTDCIKSSIELNKIENNTKIYQLALGNEEKEMLFYIAGSGSTLIPEFLGKDNENVTRKVQVKKLDTIVKNDKINYPDFVKIDVEGNELPVLMGAKETIKNNFPVFFIEIAKNLKNSRRNYTNSNFEKTFKFFEDLNYSCYLNSDNGLIKFKVGDNFDGIGMFLFLNKENHKEIIEYLNIK